MSVRTGEAGASTAAARSIDPLVLDGTGEQVIDSLRTLSRRGKLPGFETLAGGFRARAFGDPFDHWLNAAVSAHEAGSRMEFTVTPALRMPLVFLVVTVLTIQPGMWLTHSMLATYFPWYGQNVNTWWWYLPLVVLPLPVILVRMWRRSVQGAWSHALELRRTIATALGARTPETP